MYRSAHDIELRLRALISHTNAGVIQVDAPGCMTVVNERWCEMLGYTETELVGMALADVTSPDSLAETRRALERLADGGPPFVIEKNYRRKDGSTLAASSSVSALRSDDGQYAGLVAIVWDVGENGQAEEALRLAEQQLRDRDSDLAVLEDALREAVQRKDEFLAILAHELRNPLAPIRTSLELLRGANDAPGVLPRVLPVLERQVAHVVRLVDDLLDVSRITSGQITLRRRPDVLSDLVRDAVESHQAALVRAGVSLVVELPDDPCVLEVDHARIVQVLSNLLANAVRFTEKGGRIEVRGQVVARAESGPAALELVVHDTGIGIPAETLPRIFDLFVQGHHPERPGSGLGIGLALARQLVELHGGTLEAASEGAGRGSVFRLRLPLSAASPQSSADAEPPEEAPPLSLRVLVVDDNVDAADTLSILVQSAGAEVRTAYGGEDALDVGRTFQPDAVLLDVGMPGLDGYATCRQLRTEPWGRTAHVVAITGWGQPRDRQRALDAGFDAHLTKPADPCAIQRLLADLSAR